MKNSNTTNLRKVSVITGISSVIMAVAAGIAEMYARQSLIVQNDVAETAARISANPGVFQAGLVCFAVVVLCDLVVSWSFYVFLRQVNKVVASVATAFRLAYTALFGISLLNLLAGFQIISSGGDADMAMQSFKEFDHGWAISFFFFGPHLILSGYLVCKSGYAPTFFGVLLMLAGLAYLADNAAKLLLNNYENYKAILTTCVAIPSIIGELGFAIWLLIKGGKNSVLDKNTLPDPA